MIQPFVAFVSPLSSPPPPLFIETQSIPRMMRIVDDDDELIRALAGSNAARVEFENSTVKPNLCGRARTKSAKA